MPPTRAAPAWHSCPPDSATWRLCCWPPPRTKPGACRNWTPPDRERERLRDWLHDLVQHVDVQAGGADGADGADAAVLRCCGAAAMLCGAGPTDQASDSAHKNRHGPA